MYNHSEIKVKNVLGLLGYRLFWRQYRLFLDHNSKNSRDSVIIQNNFLFSEYNNCLKEKTIKKKSDNNHLKLFYPGTILSRYFKFMLFWKFFSVIFSFVFVKIKKKNLFSMNSKLAYDKNLRLGLIYPSIKNIFFSKKIRVKKKGSIRLDSYTNDIIPKDNNVWYSDFVKDKKIFKLITRQAKKSSLIGFTPDVPYLITTQMNNFTKELLLGLGSACLKRYNKKELRKNWGKSFKFAGKKEIAYIKYIISHLSFRRTMFNRKFIKNLTQTFFFNTKNEEKKNSNIQNKISEKEPIMQGKGDILSQENSTLLTLIGGIIRVRIKQLKELTQKLTKYKPIKRPNFKIKEPKKKIKIIVKKKIVNSKKKKKVKQVNEKLRKIKIKDLKFLISLNPHIFS